MNPRGVLRRATIATAMLAVVAIGPVATALVNDHAATGHGSARSTAVEAGSGLGSITADANATAIRIPLYSHQGEDAEAEIPFSQSTLQSGGVGSSLTSIFWPGETGGHAGDLFGLLGINEIPQKIADMLNDPVKAEAQTGAGNPTSSLSNPGLQMTAKATSTDVESTSALGPSGIPVLGPALGTTKASTSIKVTGPKTVTVDAMSTIHNFALGGTALTIDAITSVAHATTNGTTATGTVSTTLAGVKVAGVPVSIDDKGVHLASAGLPPTLLNTLSKLVNSTLKAIGVQIVLPKATRHVHGRHASLQAAGLQVNLRDKAYTPNVNDTGHVLVLGGISLDLSATPGYVGPTVPPLPVPTTSSGPSTGGGNPGGVVPPGPGIGTVPSGPSVANPPSPAATPVIAASNSPLPTALPIAWVILALIGCALVAAALNQVPGEVLAPGGAACKLEDDS